MGDTILEFKSISKSYSGNYVLKNVNFDVKRGEIHALIGENGAGKSTLMNILFGMSVIRDTGGFEGSVVLEGEEMNLKSPQEAIRYGIGMVHQEFMLIPGFTLTENIKLNREITRPNILSRLFGKRLEFMDRKAMSEDSRGALRKLDVNIEEYTLVEGLPVGHMQFVEIAREIDKTGIRVLVLDEPTAVLAESEAENMLSAIKKLAASGIGVIFISHRLDEIAAVADRVTVLRDGEHVRTMNMSDTSTVEIAELMVGRKIETMRSADERKISGETALRIRNLRVAMPGESVLGVDLDVRRGEIMGIAGIAGQGKIGIANGVLGLYPADGEITYEGKKLPAGNPQAVLKSGIAFVSEDRKGVGLLLDQSIEMNIAFTAMQVQNKFLRLMGFSQIKNSEIRKHAEKMIKELDIRCISPAQHTGRLSGGNQQKVCVARALTQEPKLLFVSEPTRGIDIGAKKLVLDLLYRFSQEEGLTIVMTSSELAELRSICDRIAIICDGRVAGILDPDAPDAEFGLLMSGSRRNSAEEEKGND